MQKIIEINNNIIKQAIVIINQNIFLYNALSLDIKKKAMELNMFQRKINFVIKKVINFSIIGNKKQQSEIKNVINVPKLYPIKNEIINLENIVSEEYNMYPQERYKIQNVTNDIQKNSINNKHIFELQINNNEIKAFKNNKVVYLNKKFLNTYSNLRSIKKLKKIKFIINKKTSSKYRGVSKNGRKWQVLIMINHKNYYLGNYYSEEFAARVYDIYAIKSWGIKAKTNFAYDEHQIKNICNNKINIKYNNISDIMNQLNN